MMRGEDPDSSLASDLHVCTVTCTCRHLHVWLAHVICMHISVCTHMHILHARAHTEDLLKRKDRSNGSLSVCYVDINRIPPMPFLPPEQWRAVIRLNSASALLAWRPKLVFPSLLGSHTPLTLSLIRHSDTQECYYSKLNSGREFIENKTNKPSSPDI